MKNCFSLAIIANIFVQLATAQSEVYFTESTYREQSAVSLHGISINYPLFSNEVNLFYFYELGITPSVTIHTSLGFNSSISSSYTVFRFGAEVEPRWYFLYKYLYEKGRGTPNGGLFLSLPVSFVTSFLYSPNSQNNYKWEINNYGFNRIIYTLAMGYRHHFSSRWYAEAKVQLGSTLGEKGIYPAIDLKVGYKFK